MAYEIKDPICQLAYQWQTLVTGILALIAAGVTVWFTNKAANRQITAAHEQTRVAQEQVRTMERMERQRVARESHAFLTALEAAMGTALEDIEAARQICPSPGPAGSVGLDAYAARKRIKKTAFPDLRSACLRVSSELTAPFLRLEHAIDDYSAQCDETRQQGHHAGLHNQLGCMETQAKSLRKEAVEGMRCCEEVLREPEAQRNSTVNIDAAA